ARRPHDPRLRGGRRLPRLHRGAGLRALLPPPHRPLHRLRGPRQRGEHRQPRDARPAYDHPRRVLLDRARDLPARVRRAQRDRHVRGRGAGRGHRRHPAGAAAAGLTAEPRASASMKYRRLGRTGLMVSEIGFGAWGIGKGLWIGAEDAQSLLALRRAVEEGLNFIDTALAYGPGHSERLVGQVVREMKGPLYVATKVPPKNLTWPAARGVPVSEVFPAAHIKRSAEESLRNLGLERIDLLQLHVWRDEYLDDTGAGWPEALRQLRESGQVRFVGISVNDHDPSSALRAVASGLFDTAQIIYNIFDQSPEELFFPACQKHDVGVIARVPFDEGGLTGTITPDSTFPPGDFREQYFK